MSKTHSQRIAIRAIRIDKMRSHYGVLRDLTNDAMGKRSTAILISLRCYTGSLRRGEESSHLTQDRLLVGNEDVVVCSRQFNDLAVTSLATKSFPFSRHT